MVAWFTNESQENQKRFCMARAQPVDCMTRWPHSGKLVCKRVVYMGPAAHTPLLFVTLSDKKGDLKVNLKYVS
jgi:hypothetical protein